MKREPKKSSTPPAATPLPAGADASSEWVQLQDKQAVSDPAHDAFALPSFMSETNGGGSAEKVPGFDMYRAITSGFESRRVAGPTTLLARPDGGYFSEEGTRLPPPLVGSLAAKPENVLGVDSRVVVADTSTIPWRCICHLEVEYETGPVGFGTGFLIGPKAVLTAAHVILNPAAKKKARRVRVIPGRNGTVAPYGYFVTEFADCHIPDGWLSDGDRTDKVLASDYAIIPIPDGFETEGRPTAERIGYFGLKCFTEADAAQKGKMLFVNNAGYPYEADKPYGTLWYNAGRVGAIGEQYIEYMVDTEGGQSGSPVYFYDEAKNQRYVIAIHTTGDFVNRGLRITQSVFNDIKQWSRP